MSFSRLEATSKGPLVLLFYDGFDMRAEKTRIGKVRSKAREAARFLYCKWRGIHDRSGFYTAFSSLHRSLKAYGCDVRVNDFEAARKRPHYPIGVAGYASIIDKLEGPNPILFGHGDPGSPERVANDGRFVNIIQPCDWALRFSFPKYGEKLRVWPAGIDMPKPLTEKKTVDFLIYDKIRWHRETQVPAILDKITAELSRAGRTFEVIRYGKHTKDSYNAALARSSAMLFVCEHETQGLAYQEALAAGVPVLAWDEGRLVDPKIIDRVPPDFEVSSVPYFDARCGLTFRIADFPDRLADFWKRVDTFRPRQYIEEELSMKVCAKRYLDLYSSLTDQVPGAIPLASIAQIKRAL
ncbi:glycosyltransferase family 1 protein [Rhizobium sp. KDH_Rht_773_N]